VFTRQQVRALVVASALVLGPGAAACTGAAEGTQPTEALSGVYVLRSVDGASLPHALYSYRDFAGGDFEEVVAAETLWFERPGIARRHRVIREVNQATGEATTYQLGGEDESYQLDRSRIQFIINCPINADCAAPDDGTAQHGILLLRAGWIPSSSEDERARLLYVRVGDAPG